MKTSIIISRYKENIDWIKKLNPNFQIIIYNKGDHITAQRNWEIINLPNVGRESHTWLYHIYNNFFVLNSYNIFLQGRIDDLGCMAYQDLSKYLINLDKKGFVASRLGIITPLHWKDNFSIYKDSRYKKDWFEGNISKSEMNFREFSKKLFNDIPYIFPTSYGGCFAVTKNAIQQNNQEFYFELLSILSKNKNPMEGHYMERLWCYIFTKNKPLFNSCLDVFKTKIEKFNVW